MFKRVQIIWDCSNTYKVAYVDFSGLIKRVEHSKTDYYIVIDGGMNTTKMKGMV